MRNTAQSFMAEITPGAKEWILDQARAVRNDTVSKASGETEERAGDPDNEKARTLSIDLDYEPFPKQRQFHESPAKYRLFGGAAGPGKTKALLMEAVVQAITHPKVNPLLLRRTSPELEA